MKKENSEFIWWVVSAVAGVDGGGFSEEEFYSKHLRDLG